MSPLAILGRRSRKIFLVGFRPASLARFVPLRAAENKQWYEDDDQNNYKVHIFALA